MTWPKEKERENERRKEGTAPWVVLLCGGGAISRADTENTRTGSVMLFVHLCEHGKIKASDEIHAKKRGIVPFPFVSLHATLAGQPRCTDDNKFFFS